MKRSNLWRVGLLSVVASSVLFAEAVRLDDVTVSANKMEENIKDVPQSITVIDSEVLQEKGIKNVGDIIKEVPNMNFLGSVNGTAVSFRGLNSSMFTNSNPVVIYIDGVPYSDRYDFNPSLANVEQVEILRGPQGTLYGKDAIGAVINIVTKKPSNTWSGSIGAEYGSDNYMYSTVNASGALVDDKLFLGINGLFQKDDGWITNHYSGMKENANEKKDRKTNAYVLFTPSDNFSGRLTLTDNYTKNYFMDGFSSDASRPLKSLKRSEAENVSFDVPAFDKTRIQSQSLHLTYAFEQFQVESTTTHKKVDLDAEFDTDNRANQGANDGLGQWNYTDTKAWTQELKLSSINQAFKWVGGVYIDDEERKQGPYGYEDGSFGALYYGNTDSTTNSKTQAAFGQVMVPFMDKFEVTLGGRYQRIKKEMDSLTTTSFGGVALPDFAYSDSKTWNTFLPKVALAYMYNDSTTFYASISKGYMPGGFNYFAMSGGSDENSFDPQKSLNYEVGVKHVGSNYSINAAVFRMQIEDIHIYKQVGAAFITGNAKKAHTQGIELDGRYFITDNIELSGAVGLIDAKYDDYDTGTAKYDGKRIENTPKYTANLGIAYIAHQGFYGRLDLEARGSTSFFDGANNQMVQGDGAILSHAKVGYRIKEWDVYAFVKNITNEDYVTAYQSKSGSSWVGFNEPRKIGVGFRYSF